MRVEIYADVVFLINLIMDMFIFWIVSKLIKKRVKFYRLFLGAFASAGLYCLGMFFPKLQGFVNIFAALLILMVGVMITFSPKTVKEFLKIILLAHLSAFAVGGAGIGMFYFTNISSYVGNFIGFTIEHFSLKLLISVTCTTYIIIKLSSNWITRVFIKKQTFYNLSIEFDNQESLLSALVDTGNSLNDPITKYPVIIAEFEKVKLFMPDNVKVLFYEHKENDLLTVMGRLENTKLAGKIRMIPFNSIGKQNGLLIGFKPDKVTIFNTDKETQLTDVIIGIHNFKLSKDDAYQALINPEMLGNG